MLCGTTAKIIDIGGKINCKYVDLVVKMWIYMDNVLVAGRPHEMKESNKNLRKNVNEKQNEIWPKKRQIVW